MKICIKCGIEKDESEFHKKRNKCKSCRNNESKETKLKYREKYLEMQKTYRINNPGISKRWRDNNPEKYKTIKQKSYQKNKFSADIRAKKWVLENPEKRKDIANRYFIKTFLKKQIGETPPPELVEVKVLIIKTKRLCKTLNS